MKKSIYVLCVLLSTLSLHAYEEFSDEQAFAHIEQPLIQEAPLKDYNPSKNVGRTSRGPFVSSNTGVGFVFIGSSFYRASSVLEALLGYQIFNSLKVALSYQYQNSFLKIYLREDAYISGKSVPYSFQSGSNMRTGALKVISSLPTPFSLGVLRMTPYLSFGTGIGGVSSHIHSVFIVDTGMNLKLRSLSAQMGCQYKNWSWNRQIFSVIPYVGIQLNF